MKKSVLLVLGMISLLILSSCNEDKIISNNQLVRSISVAGQDFLDGDAVNGTRAAYTVDGTGFHFTWTQGDTVGIYPVGGDQVAFPISSGEGSQIAQFDGGAWAMRSSYSYAAYYPFKFDNYKRNETSIPISYFGQIQSGNGSLDNIDKYDFQASLATVPDANGNVNIELKHLGCFVRFQLTMPVADTYKSFSIKSDKSSFVTSGYYDLTKNPVAITPTATTKSLSVKLDNTYTTDDNKVLTVYIMLAPSDFSDSNIGITINGTLNKSYSATIKGKDMLAGKAYSYAAIINTGTTIEGSDINWDENGAGLPIYDYVDLGLSVLWATCNVGANNPDEVGDYYAWGEVETYYSAGYAQSGSPVWKSGKEKGYTYTWESYHYYDSQNAKLTKYVSYVDNKEILDLEDDVASVKWGGDWRMPTSNEFKELLSNCEITRESRNGLYYKFTSKIPGYTDKYIYLPATGEREETAIKNGISGRYWTSSITNYGEDGYTYSRDGEAIRVYIDSYFDSQGRLSSGSSVSSSNIHIYGSMRYLGCAVRPVMKKKPEYVDLGLSVNWATFNVGASKPEDSGCLYAWGETETKSDYSFSTYKFSITGEQGGFSKYNDTDGMTVLDPEDDVAHEIWGDVWRMPTKEEQEELCNNCTWNKTQLNGVDGYLVTSNRPGYTDRSIFLPSSNVKYWSSSIYSDNKIFANSTYGDYVTNSTRYQKGVVRPVQKSDTWIGISSISLSKESISLKTSEQEYITPSIMSGDFSAIYPIEWSTDNKEVADVSNGWIVGLSPGTATITADCYGKVATCIVSVTSKDTPVPECVDLGLSVKWATFNVGATKPEEYGDYYAWGEVEPYYEAGYAQFISPVWKSGKEKGYSYSSYKYCNGSSTTLYKYNTQNNCGFVDSKTQLELADDVAHVMWGGNWRMPTRQDFLELISLCDWMYTNQNGVKGYKITSKKDSNLSIFLPAVSVRFGTSKPLVGYSDGDYWSSTLIDNSPCYLGFSSSYYNMKNGGRSDGRPVRPVCP